MAIAFFLKKYVHSPKVDIAKNIQINFSAELKINCHNIPRLTPANIKQCFTYLVLPDVLIMCVKIFADDHQLV